jgi:hypothetical protein
MKMPGAESVAKLIQTPCPKCLKPDLQYTGVGRYTSKPEFAVKCACDFEGWLGWVFDKDAHMEKPDFSPASRPLLRAADIPEFERDVVETKHFHLADVKIKLLDKSGQPVLPLTRSVASHLFEIEADGIDQRYVKKVRLGIRTSGRVAPLFILDYRLSHVLALPKCFAVGRDGILGTATAGKFVAEVVLYVPKR